ncbi:hypothetical protein EVG20_g2043 [Dentipellis fragilis]|uniref:PH domain-containing protein n=1 Tax=Dentipellis fragilis TaxID=205917 RepID=A0A4Y9Z9Y0_9AGAM|nr:hypothetical protein EVG20_g2043 [Dentipellis fragilis]
MSTQQPPTARRLPPSSVRPSDSSCFILLPLPSFALLADPAKQSHLDSYPASFDQFAFAPKFADRAVPVFSVDGSFPSFDSPITLPSSLLPSAGRLPPPSEVEYISSDMSDSTSAQGTQLGVTMPKKRPSLESILIPTFLQHPPHIPLVSPSLKPHSRGRSQSTSSYIAQHRAASDSRSKPVSPRDSPPPDYLIDEDPFANLTSTSAMASPSVSRSVSSWWDDGFRPGPSASADAELRSPLAPSTSSHRSRTNPSSPISAPVSLPPHQLPPVPPIEVHRRRVRPAHARPAFSQRPSLPSLRTLAESDFIYPIKARKGTLGARLPLEPWNMDIPPSPAPAPEPEIFVAVNPPNDDPQSVFSPPAPLRVDVELLHSENESALSRHAVSGVGLDVAEPPYEDIPSHVHSPGDEGLSFVQSPSALEPDSHCEQRPTDEMFSSFINTLSALSTPSHSRSSSLSSATSFSPTFSSPESIDTTPDALSRYSPESDHSEYGVEGDSLDAYNIAQDLGDDLEADLTSPVLSPRPGHTPHNSISSMPGGFPGLDDFEPSTSVDTPRASILSASANRVSVLSNGDEEWFSSNEDEIESVSDPTSEAMDGGDGAYRGSRSHASEGEAGRGSGGRDQRGQSGRNGGSGGFGNGQSGGESGSGGGGRDGRDGDRKDGRNIGIPIFSSSEESEASEDEDDTAQLPASRRPSATILPPSISSKASPAPHAEGDSSDDDVPLAQRIPTALKAQRTIRRQVRDETDQRRRDRALRRAQQGALSPADAATGSSREASRRPSRDIPRSPLSPAAMSQSQDAALQSAPALAPAPVGRPRTKTLPGNISRPAALAALTEKLSRVQLTDAPPTAFRDRKYPAQTDDAMYASSSSANRSHGSGLDEHGARERTLKPMRSFHRTNMPDHALSTPTSAPPISGQRLGRSVTSARRTHREEAPASSSQTMPSRSTTSSGGPQRSRSVRRPAEEARSSSTSARTSVDNEGRSHRPPMPPLPPAEVLSNLSQPKSSSQSASHEPKGQVAWQQRVFIGDMQRFNMMEIGPTTTSKEVIEMLDRQAQLDQWVGSGGWMLYEVAQDFGMERPIRNYEVVADVVNSWDKDRTVNMLVARKTALAAILHPSAMPSSSPVFSGYVEWESKRGKWNKRWLELKEHSLFLSKRDSGKDSTFLCSLSNFDAYQVTRPHKAPKAFVFAVKSTDNLTFFENASDYVHIFSCGERDGQNWLEKLLVARSYIINQERNVIVNSAPGGGAPNKGLSRAGTRKGQRPAQPLVNVSAPQSGYTAMPPDTDVFAPGSLLYKR